MNVGVPVADAAERALARDPDRSVIVQAPAGSGKTELLMQRYLALLARADEPEEILAVTFTRKAAADMRQRILAALKPADPDKRLLETAELATRVLARDQERGWQLMMYPGRLRIRTLDAVNNWLTDSAPVSGASTALGKVTDRPGELYELAARRTLELLADDSRLGDRVQIILRHLDNSADHFLRLMAQMLWHRDQWLPLLGKGEFGAKARETLEASLQALVQREITALDALFGDAERAELCVLLPYAASHLQQSLPADPICLWHQAVVFPVAEPEQLPLWRGLADFCLTKSGRNGPAFRVTVNKRNGFPTAKDGGDKALTDQAKALLLELAEIKGLADRLDTVRSLPEPVYSDAQWEALEAMLEILPVVAAQLILIFRERGETDYAQIATEALAALEDEHGPTGLALKLDYQIRHILIDEFQDTSRAQHRLLAVLTEGWIEGDGRTLFVVGDPMQSIYRFRQAEVALFLDLWEHGLGQVPLEQVRLTCNFRSDPTIVDWVNTTFAALMPEHNDPASGAVQFAPGSAVQSATPEARIELHAYEHPARVDEAREIGDLVEQCLAQSSTDTVGILVRTRNQARLIVPELRRRGISFAGEGLETAGQSSVEQDLLALTRALTHRSDRTAWLALLRAPWCGLSLVDLEQLCGQHWETTVLEQMTDKALFNKLSTDGQQRLQRFIGIVVPILERQGMLPLRDWIEGAWQQLNGPAALTNPLQLELAEQFFAALELYDAGGMIAEGFLLHERLPDRQETNSEQTIRVHILTLFKAKGLEYDVVILPALDGVTGRDDKAVVAWHQFAVADNQDGYLLAPIEPTGADPDKIHKLIRQFDSEQARYEHDRLLYVATTRAKQQLHLFFELRRKQDGELTAPKKGTLLHRLWPVIAVDYANFTGPAGREEVRDEWVQPRIRRFRSGWVAPAAPESMSFHAHALTDSEQHEVTFDWAGTDAMRVGSVVHRCLQFLAEQGETHLTDTQAVSLMLLEEGVTKENLSAARKKVLTALAAVENHEQGRWLLEPHESAVCEYPLTVLAEGQPKRFVIDRSFVDNEGARWIIDYKTSAHEGGNLEGFIDEEVLRYTEQLRGYRDAMQMLEPERVIRTALYFPLLQVFRELKLT